MSNSKLARFSLVVLASCAVALAQAQLQGSSFGFTTYGFGGVGFHTGPLVITSPTSGTMTFGSFNAGSNPYGVTLTTGTSTLSFASDINQIPGTKTTSFSGTINDISMSFDDVLFTADSMSFSSTVTGPLPGNDNHLSSVSFVNPSLIIGGVSIALGDTTSTNKLIYESAGLQNSTYTGKGFSILEGETSGGAPGSNSYSETALQFNFVDYTFNNNATLTGGTKFGVSIVDQEPGLRPVPEPSTLAGLGLFGAGFMAKLRKRKNR